MNKELSRILVLAPNWLGDAVMALPAIADVRRANPGAQIIVAARRAVSDLFTLAPAVDRVVRLEAGGGGSNARKRDIAALRAVQADAALLLPNSFHSAWLVARAGVPQRWGYRGDWRSLLLTRAVPRPGGSRHQGAYYQELVQTLGFGSGPLEPELRVGEVALATARSMLAEAGWDGASPLVVFAPGAAYGFAKRWIPEHVADVVAALDTGRGVTAVLVGSEADRKTTDPIVARARAAGASRLIDATGRTSLEQLAAVLALARACVSNDSGAMHVAAALGTPVVAVFGPTREYETAPLTRAGGLAEIVINPVSCRPCMLRECPIDHRCMTGIPPSRVLQAVEQML